MFPPSPALTHSSSLPSSLSLSLSLSSLHVKLPRERENQRRLSSKVGKYMKKSKTITRGASLPEVVSPHSSATGVRTRAKTLALQQRLRRASRPPPPPPPPAVAPGLDASSCPFSYLQLRSRRLRKPCLAPPSEARKGEEPVGRSRAGSGSCGSCGASCSARTASSSGGVEGEGGRVDRSDRGNGEECACDAGVDASFGENDLEIEDRDR